MSGKEDSSTRDNDTRDSYTRDSDSSGRFDPRDKLRPSTQERFEDTTSATTR